MLVETDEHIPFDFSVVEYVLLGRVPIPGPLEMPGASDRQVALDALETAGMADLADRPLTTHDRNLAAAMASHAVRLFL